MNFRWLWSGWKKFGSLVGRRIQYWWWEVRSCPESHKKNKGVIFTIQQFSGTLAPPLAPEPLVPFGQLSVFAFGSTSIGLVSIGPPPWCCQQSLNHLHLLCVFLKSPSPPSSVGLILFTFLYWLHFYLTLIMLLMNLSPVYIVFSCNLLSYLCFKKRLSLCVLLQPHHDNTTACFFFEVVWCHGIFCFQTDS